MAFNNKPSTNLRTVICCVIFSLLCACSSLKPLRDHANKSLLQHPAIANGHIGIHIINADTKRELYSYQADKYFTPASNVKIFTAYVGMKYLPDSLPGLYYCISDTALHIWPSADPTLLHPDFSRQPVVDFLKRIALPIYIHNESWKSTPYGSGWSWGDYSEYYMAERSALPVYGNVIRWKQERELSAFDSNAFSTPFVYSVPEVEWPARWSADTGSRFDVTRSFTENSFLLREGRDTTRVVEVPFITYGLTTALALLRDTLHKDIHIHSGGEFRCSQIDTVFSHPKDSLLRPMMQQSDNFFAEQILLMVAGRKLGALNERSLIDSLLSSDLPFLDKKPRWADGSGLSRYDLFTPRNFTSILSRMRDEFGMSRLKTIFPTGGQGTLRNFYQSDSGHIFAKTGTLADVVALSGFLFTRQDQLLIFSILVNHHRSDAVAIRRTVESFLAYLRRNY